MYASSLTSSTVGRQHDTAAVLGSTRWSAVGNALSTVPIAMARPRLYLPNDQYGEAVRTDAVTMLEQAGNVQKQTLTTPS